MLEINPKHNEKQKIALKTLLSFDNGVSELLYGGAAGGGKSWLGCEWLIVMCLTYPRTRYLMGRAKLLALKQTTFNTFLDVAKSFGLKAGMHFKVNNQSNIITFFNGSEIIMKDLFTYPSDPEFDSLGSLEITGAFIDEVNQVTLKAKNIVMSRIRYKLDEYNLIPKLFMSCNPAKNWVYNEFYKPYIDNKLFDYRKFIQALAEDNSEFISKHYIANLDKLDNVSRKRLRYGIWEYSDELSMFDFAKIQETLSRKRKAEKGIRCFMSVDVARLGKDKTVIMVMTETLEIVEIITMEKQRTTAVEKEMRRLQRKYDIDEYDIAIDSDGVGGGVADEFELGESIVNGSKALHGENYNNLKTQLYFKLAELVNDDSLAFNSITDEQAEILTQELQILRREKIDMDGKICMTTKADIKKQINRSPDYSDALAYLMIFFLEEDGGGYESIS